MKRMLNKVKSYYEYHGLWNTIKAIFRKFFRVKTPDLINKMKNFDMNLNDIYQETWKESLTIDYNFGFDDADEEIIVPNIKIKDDKDENENKNKMKFKDNKKEEKNKKEG